MKSTDEDVKVLSRAVLSDAHTDAEESLTNAKVKAEEIRKQAMDQAAEERSRILERASAEADRVRSQAVATTQLKARTMQLEQREKLLENVFSTAQQRLSTIQKSTDYEKTAHLLLREALVQLGAKKAIVRADETTRKFFTSGVIEQAAEAGRRRDRARSAATRYLRVDALNERIQQDSLLIGRRSLPEYRHVSRSRHAG